jgi:hypothetical protein
MTDTSNRIDINFKKTKNSYLCLIYLKFKPIVYFLPDCRTKETTSILPLYSNIPIAPVYGVHNSQLARYARACSLYADSLKHHLLLRTELLNQVLFKSRLILYLLRSFFGRYQHLVEKYFIILQMTKYGIDNYILVQR